MAHIPSLQHSHKTAEWRKTVERHLAADLSTNPFARRLRKLLGEQLMLLLSTPVLSENFDLKFENAITSLLDQEPEPLRTSTLPARRKARLLCEWLVSRVENWNVGARYVRENGRSKLCPPRSEEGGLVAIAMCK